jgi:DUF2892 family protein
MEPRFIRTHMHINLHPIDRWVRILGGGVLCILAFRNDQIYAWYLLGVIPLVSGMIGFCPIYYLLGLNTNRWARVKADSTRK